jgi:transcriptional regulator with XRE-family HTH domain
VLVLTLMPPDNPSLCDRLKQLRAEFGLSYQQLSERSYVDMAHLHRLETGQAARPSRDVLIRIAFGLGLEIEAADSLIAAAGHLPLLKVPVGSCRSSDRASNSN